MSFLEEYKQKLVSADEAVKIVKSGDWVDYGWCTGTPDALDKALARRTDELKDVNVRGGILLKPLAIFEREDAGEHFTWNSWHMGGYERKLIKRGCSFYSPIRYSELPRYYRDSTTPDDVAMFQVAPMDSHGYFNFGPNASHLGAVCETSKKIIVEVNENMPRCHGGSEANVHISQVSYIVEGDNPAIGELGAGGPATDVDKKVAELIVDQIPNGACLQLGIGGMPNAVGSLIAESDLKDLGVHTEMYVDAFVDIAKAGKITGAKKNIDRYRQAYGFGAGTKKMYDYLDENPELMSAPVSYTNDIKNIAALDNFISINNCVDLDLFGQISGVILGITFQNRFQNDTFRAIRNDLGGRHKLDTILFQLGLIPGTVVAVSGKAVQFPDQHDIKQLFVAVFYHLLKLRAVVCLGRDGTVNVVLDDGDAVLFRIGRALPDLAFDGFFTLVVTGIAGVDHSGHGRHLTLHIIERWSVLLKQCFV